MKTKYRNQIISTLIVITASLLLMFQIDTGVSFASVIENGNQNNSTSTSVSTTQVFHTTHSIPPPSLNITYPSYPPTVTTGKMIIQGTANDSKSGIRGVSASAHVFPFNGNFTVKLASTPSPIRPNNWSHWSVPLIINTTGTYRIVISASNNAGNTSYAETTINAALPAKTPQAVTANTEYTLPKIAFVRPTFTEAAYQPHGFYTFYFKYKFPPFGKNITTDLDMLTVKTPVSVAEFQNVTGLKHLSNFTALIPAYDPDLQKFWIPLTNTVKKDVPNATVTVMRDEDVNDGHIFNSYNNKSNAYDVLFLLHNEYVTQSEYSNLKQFVNNGGKIVFIDGDVFYAQVRYDKQNHTISLVKGHDWQFDGKVARRSVSERWYNETKQWVGGNFLVNDIHDKITFANNPFNYTHFEEQFVNNPKDQIIINYGIKFPKDYLQYNVFPPDKQNGNITIATYTLNYGAGRVIMLGLYGQNLVGNKQFINFFNKLITYNALCYKLQPCNLSQLPSTTIGVQDNKGNVSLVKNDSSSNAAAQFGSNQNSDNAKIIQKQSLVNNDSSSNAAAQFGSNQILPDGCTGRCQNSALDNATVANSPGLDITQTTGQVSNAYSVISQNSPNAKNGKVPYSSTSRANYDDFNGPSYTLRTGQISPNGKWQAIYAQGRADAVIVKQDSQTGKNAMFFNPTPSFGPTIPPPPGREPDLHSSLVVSTAKYEDFDLTLNVKTVKQLRTPTPNNWENAWVMWNRPEAADDYHYYAYTLFANGGGQLEKKDNKLHDVTQEIQLAYPHSPSIKYNTWQTWRIMVTGTATGTPNIKIWIDGVQALNYTDNNPSIPRNSSTMLNGGSIVLYCEDSVVAFTNVSINPL